MRLIILIVIYMLLSVEYVCASDQKIYPKTYSFSQLDYTLFYSKKDSKFKTPFSTSFVDSFSDTHTVTIEKSDYDALYAHALKRSLAFKTIAQKIDAQDNPLYKQAQKMVEHFYTTYASFKPLKHTKTTIKLKERDLMHLLQWTHAIKPNWSSYLEDTFQMEIVMYQESIMAKKKLNAFLVHKTCRGLHNFVVDMLD